MLSLKQVGIEEPSNGIGPVNWPMTPGYHNDNKWSEAVHQVGCFPVDSEDTISFMQAVRYRQSEEVHIFRVSGCRDGRFCQRKTSCFVMPRGHWVKYSPKWQRVCIWDNSMHKHQNKWRTSDGDTLRRLRGMKVGERIYEPFMWHMSNGLSHQGLTCFFGL